VNSTYALRDPADATRFRKALDKLKPDLVQRAKNKKERDKQREAFRKKNQAEVEAELYAQALDVQPVTVRDGAGARRSTRRNRGEVRNMARC